MTLRHSVYSVYGGKHMGLYTVSEISKMAKVSPRTLHYYDEIGLLKPAEITSAGYRMYDDTCIKKLQDILFFRELEFSLDDIGKILNSPKYDRVKALENQIGLLKLKRDHLDQLIDFAQRAKLKGETDMSFEAFDKSKIEGYQKLAKETWGETEAYKEYEEKAAKTSDTEKRQAAEDMMQLFFEFGDMKALDPSDSKVQAQVKKLQDFITKNYYTCTNEILAGLGQMYAAGGDFTANIDLAGGKGTAEFVSKAIEEYCK